MTEELYVLCERLGDGVLDEEEERVMVFLLSEHPEMVTSFRAQVPKARASILRRLVESLLREDVMELATGGIEVDDGERTWLQVPIDPSHDEWLMIPIGRTYAFRRIEVEGEIRHLHVEKVRPLTHPVELLGCLERKEQVEEGRSSRDWMQLARELQNGCANLALALAYDAEQRKHWQTISAQVGVHTSIALAERLQAMRDDFDAGLFFEQMCVEGHNLHPGAKTKMGMEPRDVLAYAPEFHGRPRLRWVAIRREWAGWSYAAQGEAEPNAALFTEWPGVAVGVRMEMERLGLSEHAYLAVPVHPWQYEHVLRDLYRRELTAGLVVPLPGVVTAAGATSSFRTVISDQLGKKARRLAVKVAVNSQMTSTVRSISRNTAFNGPRFTTLIRDVMSREPKLAETFVPVNEIAGFYFQPGANESDGELGKLKSRNLTAVWREDVSQHVGGDELAIAGIAYYAESPVSGRTVLEELVEAYAQTVGVDNLQMAAHHFMVEYAEIAVPGFLTLMVKYGIGLEGHLQNSVGVFRAGRPQRMLFRDWGGVRISRERLEGQGLHLDLMPGSVVLTDDVREMQNKVFYTVYQNHLAEMILQLSKHFGLSETALWREIRRISDAVFEDLLKNPQTADSARVDLEALYRAEVEHKALTTMRLSSEEKGYSYATVANPLSR
ncbi:IucA/IucC family protein [Tumebacillus sp. ITR2]|uniref:IucA/IucC family protein n=1 Tax=Tumebacillus amylolyticus TaxID=2801339 RepID=A0ABS1JDX8_9BACL|nr:IucA/IucC family protein [Tumebacillus amylolyticus]MBL0388486.1 IucA/IucC family protein [Tumebacillus amylolyticus]